MFIQLLKLAVCFSITDNMVSKVKVFPDHAQKYSAINNANISADEINKDLEEISEWVCNGL